MKYSLYILILFFGVQNLIGQHDDTIEVGSRFSIASSILEEDRHCLISLPDAYDTTHLEKKYPLMILLDGYTHFKTAAGIVHFMSSARNRNQLMPEAIIVAIENVDRERDFTVTKIKTKRPNTMGGGRDFLNFIEKELIPYIDQNYNTQAERILVGHSLGGLLTLNAYMDENSLFNAYVVIDPSIWWDEQMMIEKVNSTTPSSLKKKLYIATANQGEANYDRNKKRHDTLYSLLLKKAAGPVNVRLEYFEEENHRSIPLMAIYKGLKYVYSENQ